MTQMATKSIKSTSILACLSILSLLLGYNAANSNPVNLISDNQTNITEVSCQTSGYLSEAWNKGWNDGYEEKKHPIPILTQI